MGLASWLKALDPAKREKIFVGVRLLGLLVGRTSKAERIVAIMETVPGRVEALNNAVETIGRRADDIDDGVESSLSLTSEEVSALDDYFDLRNRTRRELRRLWNRIKD